MNILKCDNPSIQHEAISKALFSGCAIVSTVLTKLKDTEHIFAVLETPIETDPTADSESWETINEFLHGKYGSGDAIAESEPSQADKLILDNFYSNGSADDRFLVNSSWYMHPQFRIVSWLEWWSNLEFRIQVLKNSGLFFMIGSVVEHVNSGISGPQI